MALDKDTLSKLDPQKRIKRLQELEEERKKELKEIESLLQASQTDLRAEDLAQRITPQNKEVDIGRLFTKEDEQQTNAASETEQVSGQYHVQEQIQQDYKSLKEMLDYQISPENMSNEQMRQLDEIETRLNTVAGYTVTADERAKLVSATRQTLKRIKKYAGQ